MNNLKDIISNKSILFFGDSITHNWDKYDHDLNLVHGDNYQYGLGSGYVKMLDDACHFKHVENKAVSGGCYASIESKVPARQEFRHFVYQVKHNIDKIKNAEIIMIMYGTNDYSEQVSFGKDDSLDETTFYGGMNVGLNIIKQANPKAKIFMLGCLNRTCPIDAKTFNYSINEYNLAIKQCARAHDVIYIDIFDVFKYPTNQYNDNKELIYTDDGLHPNHNGYVALTNNLLNWKY